MNGRRAVRRATVLCVVGWAASALAGTAIEDLATRVRPSVVEVLGTVDGTGDTSYGTGFVVSGPGLVLTNAHVVRNVSKPMVRTIDGALLASVDVLFADERIDLALLRVTGLSAAPLPVAPGDPPPVGTRVVAVGHPRGYEFTVSDGIVSATRKLERDGIELIQTTAPISPGSSGGPLLDLDGRVVGVCSLTLSEGQNINFAVPAARIAPFVEQALAVEAALEGGDPARLGPAALASAIRRQRERGDLARAAELAERAVARFPRELRLLEEAAEVAWARARYEEVEEFVDRMMAIAPHDPAALQIEGSLLAQRGEVERAARAAREALERGLTGEKAAQARALLGECLGRMGRAEEALEQLELALADDRISSLPDYRALHAFLLQAVGRAAEADREAVAALELSGWDPLVVAALRERGLPRLVEVVSQRSLREGGRLLVRGVVRNRGPVPLERITVSAEGLDGTERTVASGAAEVRPARLVPGQSGAFEIELGGDGDSVRAVRVRVVDFAEPADEGAW